MNEQQITQMGPMWLLAGLSAGWLAEHILTRRGYGLIRDMGLGLGASMVGGGLFLAFSGLSVGMFAMFVVGFVVAATVIVTQRLCWPRATAATEATAGRLLVKGDEKAGRPRPTRALVRIATTGIYLVRDLPQDLQRAARVRAVSEGTTLGHVLVQGLREYAAGTWTPQRDGTVSGLTSPSNWSHDLDRVVSQR
jgi:uncharacterized membrane protein YeaQ/YmgE (transglycosylase-associated protein family)